MELGKYSLRVAKESHFEIILSQIFSIMTANIFLYLSLEIWKWYEKIHIEIQFHKITL